eukprot:4828234-Amphidinium_carterae.1
MQQEKYSKSEEYVEQMSRAHPSRYLMSLTVRRSFHVLLLLPETILNKWLVCWEVTVQCTCVDWGCESMSNV